MNDGIADMLARCVANRDSGNRILFPLNAVQQPSARLGSEPAPLLPEKGHATRLAQVTKAPGPLHVRRSKSASTLSTSDEPMDASQVEHAQRPKQWLRADEANGRRDMA